MRTEPGKYPTFCPECGFGVVVDEEGLCVSCGSNAIGRSVDALFAAWNQRTPEPEAGESPKPFGHVLVYDGGVISHTMPLPGRPLYLLEHWQKTYGDNPEYEIVPLYTRPDTRDHRAMEKLTKMGGTLYVMPGGESSYNRDTPIGRGRTPAEAILDN